MNIINSIFLLFSFIFFHFLFFLLFFFFSTESYILDSLLYFPVYLHCSFVVFLLLNYLLYIRCLSKIQIILVNCQHTLIHMDYLFGLFLLHNLVLDINYSLFQMVIICLIAIVLLLISMDLRLAYIDG